MNIDKTLFLSFSALGSVFLVGTYFLSGDNPSNTGVLLLSLIMVVYGTIQILRFHPPEEKATIGDQIYTLGLLFTFISIAGALYAFGSDKNNLDLILISFSIALTTTIIGILFRTLLQDTSDPYRNMDAQIISMTEKIAKTNSELEKATDAFAKMTLNIKEAIEEAVRSNTVISQDTISQINTVAKQSIDKFQDMGQRMKITIEESGSNIGTAIEESTQVILKTGNELKGASQTYASKLQNMSTAIADITKNINAFSGDFLSLGGPIQAIKKSVEEADGALAQFKSSISDTVGSEIQEEMLEHIKDKISEKLQPLNDSIKQLSTSLLSLASSTQGISKDMSEHIREQVSGELFSLNKSINDLSTEFLSLSKSVGQSRDNLNNLQVFQDSYRDYSEKLKQNSDQNIRQLDQLSSSIEQQIKMVDTLVNKVHEGLVSIIRNLQKETGT